MKTDIEIAQEAKMSETSVRLRKNLALQRMN